MKLIELKENEVVFSKEVWDELYADDFFKEALVEVEKKQEKARNESYKSDTSKQTKIVSESNIEYITMKKKERKTVAISKDTWYDLCEYDWIQENFEDIVDSEDLRVAKENADAYMSFKEFDALREQLKHV